MQNLRNFKDSKNVILKEISNQRYVSRALQSQMQQVFLTRGSISFNLKDIITCMIDIGFKKQDAATSIFSDNNIVVCGPLLGYCKT